MASGSDAVLQTAMASGSDAVLQTAMASGSDAVLQTEMPGDNNREKCDADCFGWDAFSCAYEWLVRRRRRHCCGQGKGRTVRRLSRRNRHFANREYPLARGPAGSVHPMAAGFLPQRRAQE